MRITEWEREQSRQKIVNHIARYGNNKDFSVTPKLMKYWWKHLNAAVFGNLLNEDTVFKTAQMFYREGQVYGYCGINSATNISFIKMDSLNVPKHLGKVGFLTILVHEMVHQYQYEYKSYPGHGKTFHKWVDVINHKLGLPLSELIDDEDIWDCYESTKRLNRNKGN